MVRNRDSLVPIGDAVSGLDDGSVNELRKALPQARRYFTIADQVNLLVGASEADQDRGFLARTMALCSLPRSKPRQPEGVQARQRPLHALHERYGG